MYYFQYNSLLASEILQNLCNVVDLFKVKECTVPEYLFEALTHYSWQANPIVRKDTMYLYHPERYRGVDAAELLCGDCISFNYEVPLVRSPNIVLRNSSLLAQAFSNLW